MPSTSAAMVKRIAPDFASLDDVLVEQFIEDAEAQFNAEAFGSRAAVAEANLVAHLLAAAFPALVKSAGPVSQRAVGAISVHYAVAPVAAGDLATSRWGVEYRRHVALNGLSFLVA